MFKFLKLKELLVNIMSLRSELETTINQFSAENVSNTPDYILAEYLMGCLDVFDKAINERDRHHGFNKCKCDKGNLDES